nr:immunoglobulin light chain junction region [Macaca mulatta]
CQQHSNGPQFTF